MHGTDRPNRRGTGIHPANWHRYTGLHLPHRAVIITGERGCSSSRDGNVQHEALHGTIRLQMTRHTVSGPFLLARRYSRQDRSAFFLLPVTMVELPVFVPIGKHW